MLQIDLKPSRLNPSQVVPKGYCLSQKSLKQPHKGINSYHSLNRAVRIKDMIHIVDENKIILKKLQQVNSFYSINEWEKENKRMKKLSRMISKNSDRYCKNPYFVNSSSTLLSDHHSLYNDKRTSVSQHSKKRSSYRTIKDVNFNSSNLL